MLRPTNTFGAETYERELTAVNVFEIQSEIAASIATALEAKLTPQEQNQGRGGAN